MGNAVVSLFLVLALPPQSSSGEGLLSEIRAIEAERSRALKAADVPAVERLYAEDFVGITASGQILRKQELVENLRRRGPQELTFAAEELEVRLVGGVVLALGRVVGRDDAGAVVREGRFLHVYQRRGGEWKLVAAQATPLAE